MGFFDDFSKKVSATTNSVTEKTNKMAKESKLKKTMMENNTKITVMYSDLGKAVLEKKDNSEEVMKLVEETAKAIEDINKENEEIKVELLLLNDKRKCTNCGAEIDSKAAFCPECGKEQEKIEPKEEEKEEVIPEGKIKCSGCGEIIEDKYTFCPLCGAKNEKTAVEGEVIEETKNEENGEEF